jgi:site-specific DNA-methyltransferase (adenine-specific)
MINLYNDDCFKVMQTLESGSIDLVLCDLPYGIVNWTNPYAWDKFLDLDLAFSEMFRLLKPLGSACLFGTEPYSTYQRSKAMDRFKYDVYWVKNKQSSPMLAKVKPLRSVEIVSVFSRGTTSPGRKNNMTYNPQGLVRVNRRVSNSKKDRMVIQDRPSLKEEYTQEFTNYPKDYLFFDCESGHHPTQKPVALMEYLIRTYTNKGETVLDFTMGSGTTGVAAKQSGRDFIGIELDEKYFKIAEERVDKAIAP